MAKSADLVAQSRQLWVGLTPRRKLGLIAGAVIPIAIISAIVLTRSGPTYAVLYSNLAPEDAGELVAELGRQGVPYRLRAGGTIVEVPKDRVHEMRIGTAAAGLPRGGGIGFEVFDGQSFGTSSFVEQVNYRRAVAGELSRSITALAAVTGARVHIAMGNRSVFRDADELPTASVALRLHNGRKLTDNQVRGIVNLVASSIDGLATERVVVIDERGTVLSQDEEESGSVAASGELEAELASKIQRMLDRVVGPGHSAVTVTAKIDKRKVDTTEEVYDPKSTSVRSETRSIEGRPPATPTPAAGVAGAPGDLRGTEPPTANGDGKLHEVRNYELNRTVRHIVGPTSAVERLHVAVLVDFARDEDGAPIARTEKQLGELAAIAREAAGIDEARGDRFEIRNVPFVEEPAIDIPEVVAVNDWPLPISKQLTILAAGGLGALLLIVIVFLKLRKRKKRPRNLVLPAPVSAIEAALAAEDEEDDLEATKELPAPDQHTRVLAAVTENPTRAGRVVAAWLSESAKKESKAA